VRILKFSIITLGLLLVSPISNSTGQDTVKEPLIHVIVSDQIRGIMLKLNDLVNVRGMTALQIMELRVQHLKNLISTIDDLVDASEELNDAIPGIRLSTENKITFEALAKKLQDEAANLKTMAEETNYAGMEPAYRRLTSTCDACHQLFRF
jgi:cytochrome c556